MWYGIATGIAIIIIAYALYKMVVPPTPQEVVIVKETAQAAAQQAITII